MKKRKYGSRKLDENYKVRKEEWLGFGKTSGKNSLKNYELQMHEGVPYKEAHSEYKYKFRK